jgi:hypothetical protein
VSSDHGIRRARAALRFVHADSAKLPRFGVASPPNETGPFFRDKRAANESWLLIFCCVGSDAALAVVAGVFGVWFECETGLEEFEISPEWYAHTCR